MLPKICNCSPKKSKRRFHFGQVILVLYALLYLLSQSAVADRKIETRIVGGHDALSGQYPFMVAILRAGVSSVSLAQICGGSIISSKYVMTAAHCVTNDSGVAYPSMLYEVGLGYTDLDKDSGERVKVKSISVHPNYKQGASNNNDIALLELETLTTRQKVALANVADGTFENQESTAIGWGLTDPNKSNSYVSKLQEVGLPIVSNTDCHAAYGNEITDNMICAGLFQGGKDSCSGDSGGPLLVSVSGKIKQVGIVSFGSGCAEPNYYGVYARVSSFASFIEPYLDKDNGGGQGGGEELTKVTYGTWNGFLNMINILELINTSNAKRSVQVSVYDNKGKLKSTSKFTVKSGNQSDVVINSLAGFSKDSFGVIRVEGDLAGRILYYRPHGNSFDNFDYVFGLDLERAIQGMSHVSFNTYQPSLKISDASNLVANWLSITNLSLTKKKFSITKYSDTGDRIDSLKLVEINPMERRDFDGGHVLPGPQKTGLIEIVPQDTNSPYISQLMRYGYANDGGFDFALSATSRVGIVTPMYLPVGSELGAQNWVEIINTTSADTSLSVSFYYGDGVLVKKPQTIKLRSRTQRHIDATSTLGSGQMGSLVITPSINSGIIAQSMYYVYAADFSINAAYGIQGNVGISDIVTGSYNLNLEMKNYLNITNLSDMSNSYELAIFRSGSQIYSKTISLEAHKTTSLSLHDTSTYGTTNNTYGMLRLTPNKAQQYISHVARAKHNASNYVEFAILTKMKGSE